ncbi:hypothetical protein [Thalassospira alkalitolerans]|uniref:Uncharacterized protein n=1 Tax=Thalassospira alkalitolerans TaxID=1293890 RepID=A0A1Y2LFQ5_9PROT|nr:hypothetical protein [Thalassospira alkalitolerans]OSQ48718.1 hypothetical protein TALK_07190 [Thalassospira alkalitolerans]|tara:strand:+ start:80574 stop:80807 length:234 start_codon:yes stop_codon:yes gene_type:complete
MDSGSLWGIVMIVVGAVAAMIVARVARRPFRYRHDGKRLEREKSFLSRPVNFLALLAAVVTFVLGLVWRMTGTGPLQ